MSTVAEAPPAKTQSLVLGPTSVSQFSSRIADYLELSRPRIAVMVLVTVTVGYLLGRQGNGISSTLWHAWLGILLVAAGSSIVNQWFEQHTDARMRRTRERPLPAGRLRSAEVLLVGASSAVAGCLYLAVTVNSLTAVLTGLTFVLYAGAYTPLKRVTSLCTAVGAIPGAMPPVLGWVAAGQPLDVHAFALFGLLFFWQFPHFLAIAWLHREDYLAAGLRMLPGGRPMPRVTGLMATAYALGLVPISIVPSWLGLAGQMYSLVAVLCGLVYVATSIGFAISESRLTARRVLWASLLYLPLVLGALALDHLRLLQ